MREGREGTRSETNLQIGFESLAGKHYGPAPSRPDAGDRVVRVAIVTPADVLGVWRLDTLGVVLGHHELLGRDIHISIVAVGAFCDDRLDVDAIPSGIAQDQCRG